MSIHLDNNLATIREVPQTETTQETQAKNIAYKANPNNSLERNPEQDTYNKKSTGKKVGIAASLIALAALVVGGICYRKGGAEGVEKKFTERLKDGWKELSKAFSRNKNVAAEEIETEITASAESAARASEEAATIADEIIPEVEIIS